MNTWVGFAEGIMGATTLVLALPLGFLSDSVDRIFLMRLAATIGIGAAAISAFAFAFDNLILLYANLVCWGVFTGLQGTAAEAVFADSIDRGQRSSKFMIKSVLSTVGLSLGPLLMLFLFYTLGDKWSLHNLHIPLVCGCLFAPLCCLPFLFFKDPIGNAVISSDNDAKPISNSKAQLQEPLLPLPSPPTASNFKSPSSMVPSTPLFKRDRVGSHFSDFAAGSTSRTMKILPTPQLNPLTDNALLGSGARISNADEMHFSLSPRGGTSASGNRRLSACSFHEAPLEEVDENNSDCQQRLRSDSINPTFGERCIPYIITMADFITEVGAGMTVRFFPLFFMKDYKMTPVGLCGIFCLYPLFISSAMPLCQYLGSKIGRAHASLMFQISGCLMLTVLASIDNLPILIAVFMIRGQLQNAAYPVDRSILMDYIPSEHRGKWASITSLTGMTWSGSAVLGGFLADKHDYRFTFLITAVIYACGSLCYSPLIFLVPRKEAISKSSPKQTPQVAPTTPLTTTTAPPAAAPIAIPPPVTAPAVVTLKIEEDEDTTSTVCGADSPTRVPLVV